ncbi:MAG: IS66 family transposase zinc-finger binding domain-containing protein [Gammaproteobacteria bacterium]|nr:IS66 family transposase zinc-finger binding domain-containing protein [Gammaproteobacteria bacterium]
MRAILDTALSKKQLEARIHELEKQVKLLEEQNRLLLHYRFGAKTETLSENQLALFDSSATEQQIAGSNQTESVNIKSHQRKRSPRIGFADDLPKRRFEIDLEAHEKTCECCQSQLTRIGDGTTRKVEFIPAKVHVIEYV